MAYISAVLKRGGYEVTVLNLNQRDGLCKDIIQEELKRNLYDVIFMGGLSIMYPNIRDYITDIREVSPESKTVVGGGLISAQPDLMLKLLRPDFIIIWEGEETALELVRCIDNGNNTADIKGIGYLDTNGNPIITEPRPPIENLDDLPYPDCDGLGYEEYLDNQRPNSIAFDTFDFPRPYHIVGSRSCPFSCTFCFHTIGKKYRQRSIENIMDEIRHVTWKYKINVFLFLDELFAHDKARALEFCRQFNEFASTVPWEMRLTFMLRVDCIDGEVINTIKNSRYTVISLGLESYSKTVLDSMKKHITPEQIKNAVRLIADRKLGIMGGFIFGDPAETLETAQETLDFYYTHQDILRGGIALNFIIPFQGSPIYNYCLKKGIIKDEVKFIEQREREGYSRFNPVNLTGLSDKDFEVLKDRVLTADYVGCYYSIPTSIKIVNGISEVHTKCPYCKRMTVLKNVDIPHKFQQIGVMCRHTDCNGRFRLVTSYFPIAWFMVKIFGFQRLYKIKKAIWGTKPW
jgi:radical SAM superfamily enzyme YgiQ (UPF0313 family)